MDGNDIKDLFIERVMEQFEIPIEQCVAEANFIDDLGADSLDLVSLTMDLEDLIEEEIPERILEKIQTIGDVFRYLEEKGIA